MKIKNLRFGMTLVIKKWMEIKEKMRVRRTPEMKKRMRFKTRMRLRKIRVKA